MSEAERLAKGVENLPGSLEEALAEMSRSELVKAVLGDHVYSKYMEAKRAEWDAFRTTVTEWELDRYLLLY
jgi:glutamine synthetase